MDDSQNQKSLIPAAGLEDSALARLIMQRNTGPLGVIDTRHTQDHYSRLTEWPAQRLGLLDQLKERYGLSSDEPATGNMVYQTSQEQPTDAEAIHTDAHLSSMSGGESFEAPKKSNTVARATPDKFRVSRKPIFSADKSTSAGKPTQPDSHTASTQATADSKSGFINHLQHEEASATTPTKESLAKASEVTTNSKTTTQPTLRLSRKRAGKLVQQSSGAGVDERGTGAASDIVRQQNWTSEAETPQPPAIQAAMPFISPVGHDKTSVSADKERAILQRATHEAARDVLREEASERAGEALAVSPEKPSTLDQQSSAKGNAHLLLRKSKTDEATTMQPAMMTQPSSTMAALPSESEGVGRAASMEGSVLSSSKKMNDESVAGGVMVRHVAREMKNGEMKNEGIDRSTTDGLPLVKAEAVSSRVQRVQRVQLKRREGAAEIVGPASSNVGSVSGNVGPVFSADEGVDVSSTARAVEMRPASSRGQATGIVWRKSAGESSHDGPSVSGGNGYSSSSMPLTSVQVQRQVRDDGGSVQGGPVTVVQRIGHGAGPSHAQAATEVDLERITEHVSRAIFRQLSIERERRGF